MRLLYNYCTITISTTRTYMIGQRRLCRTRSILLRAHGWWMVEVCLPRCVVCHAEPAKRNHRIAIGFSFFHLFCDCESQELLSFDFKMKRDGKIEEIALTSSINFFAVCLLGLCACILYRTGLYVPVHALHLKYLST